mmetsp:Transcript_3338/g.5071  ORF Transcript_3338/g.5071 Transcript_3338/m.5071 type:complete len:143 (-) Transcript_3338:421-849(-)
MIPRVNINIYTVTLFLMMKDVGMYISAANIRWVIHHSTQTLVRETNTILLRLIWCYRLQFFSECTLKILPYQTTIKSIYKCRKCAVFLLSTNISSPITWLFLVTFFLELRIVEDTQKDYLSRSNLKSHEFLKYILMTRIVYF